MVTYFKQSSGYIAVTDKCPQGFKGVLFVGKGGLTITSVTEQVFAPSDLKKLQPVPKDGMPDEWLTALGYERPAKKPQPKPVKPAPTPEPEIEWPIFDDNAELLDLAPLRRGFSQPAPTGSRDPWTYVGWVIGAIIMAAYLWLNS